MYIPRLDFKYNNVLYSRGNLDRPVSCYNFEVSSHDYFTLSNIDGGSRLCGGEWARDYVEIYLNPPVNQNKREIFYRLPFGFCLLYFIFPSGIYNQIYYCRTFDSIRN